MVFASGGFTWLSFFEGATDRTICTGVLKTTGWSDAEVQLAYTELNTWMGGAFAIPEGTHALLFLLGVCGSLLLIGGFAGTRIRSLRGRSGMERFFADDGLSTRNVVEVVGSSLLDLMSSMMPRSEAKNFFPAIATIFVYLLTCNLLALIPGFAAPTTVMYSGAAVAIFSFCMFNYAGLSRQPWGYIKHLWGPITHGPLALIGLLIMVIEMFGLVLRPFTLSVRIWANMNADHSMFVQMSDMFQYVLPMGLLIFAAFVSFIQAFVFTLLSSIYIALSLPDDHH